MQHLKLGAIALVTGLTALASQAASAAETLRLAHGLAERGILQVGNQPFDTGSATT